MSMTINRIGRTTTQHDVMHLDNNTNWIVQNWLEGQQRVLKLEWIMYQMETWLNACSALMWSCISAVKSVTIPVFFSSVKVRFAECRRRSIPPHFPKIHDSKWQIKTISIGTKRDFTRLMMATWCLPQPTMTLLHFCKEPPLPADCLIQYHLLLWVFTFLCALDGALPLQRVCTSLTGSKRVIQIYPSSPEWQKYSRCLPEATADIILLFMAMQ